MPSVSVDRPNVIALPPFILAAILALGLLLNFVFPAKLPPNAYALPLGLLLCVGAIALAVLAILEMFRAHTTPDVRKPTTDIVTSGVFKLTRNPIYLAMVLLCLGIGFALDSLWILALASPLALILQKGVIEREEIYLERKFGEKYLAYKARVRRWV